jgi:Fe2+ or Zn2+ uptake regulation protein
MVSIYMQEQRMHEQHLTTLKQLNLKATPKRLAILSILARESTYCSPEEVWQRLKSEFGRIGLPTIYRNLEELASGGVISQVLHPNRQLYYHYCANTGHHHHFICVACRRVEDVDACIMAGIEQEVGERIGGRVLSHIVQVNGLCRQCLASDSAGKGN